METKFYNITCLNGHVWREPETSTLGKKAAAYEAKGFLSALPVPCRDCEDCEWEDRGNRMIGEFTDEDDGLDLMAQAEDRAKAWDDLEPGER